MTPSVPDQLMSEYEPRIQTALAELRERISSRFPGTVYTTAYGEDPEGIRLTAIVDVDDLADVTDVFISRLTDLQVDEGLPVYVVLEQPPERVSAQVSQQEKRPDRGINRIPALLSALGVSELEKPLA